MCSREDSLTQMSPVERYLLWGCPLKGTWTVPAVPADWEAHASDFLAGDPCIIRMTLLLIDWEAASFAISLWLTELGLWMIPDGELCWEILKHASELLSSLKMRSPERNSSARSSDDS